MKYRIVQTMSVVTETTDIFEWCKINNREVSEMSERRRSVLRSELQSQPKIEGLYGPMWDGDAVRYEDQATYNQLST